MLWGILCVILTNIFSVFVPVLVRLGLNEALYYTSLNGAGSLAVFTPAALKVAMAFGLLILLAAAIRGIFMYLMRQKIVVVSREIEYDLKNDIFSHYQKLDTSFYRKNFTGDMMARIGEDVSNVRMYVGPAVMYFVNIIFTFTVVLYQMFSVNAILSFYVLLPMPILSFSIYKVSKIINRRSMAIQTKLSAITTYAQETFSGIRVIKSFGAESNFKSGFEEESKEYRKYNLKLAMVNSLFFPLMLLLIGLSSLIVLYLGGIEVAKGRFTAGNIAEFMIYLNMLIWPVASLGWTTALVQKAAASQTRINAFLETRAESEKHGSKVFNLEKEISVENLCFQYENATKPTVSNIHFKIKKGQILGITGHTGSGKSTIIHLLMRLYEPVSGKILADGIDLLDTEIESFRKKVAFVPQDVFLFSETIEANIAFGTDNENIGFDKIKEAADFAGLLPDIEGFPNGFKTILGERGVTLSGGQKQRLSIARAFVRDADFFVFDDCLSAVDATTEMKIIRGLARRLKGKTAVIVSHRVAPLAVANEIIVLKNGAVAEQGSKEQLLALNGEFAMLTRLQQIETEAEV